MKMGRLGRERMGVVAVGVVVMACAYARPSWGDAGPGAGRSPDVESALREARQGAVPGVGDGAARPGYVARNDPLGGKPGQGVEWVPVAGGKFAMGTDDGSDSFKDAKPVHEVDIKAFEISKTLVTVEQYAECVIKGGCTEPRTGAYGYCNWGMAGRERHPVNCVDWGQANDYARFKGARLLSESEYEYAATSGGKSQKYPWGNEDAAGVKAVMAFHWGTAPVCSIPAGNAKVSGGELCDMVGNVWEWVQDKYQDSYVGAPADGSAFEGSGSDRVARGGSFLDEDAQDLRADRRLSYDPDSRRILMGFRIAR